MDKEKIKDLLYGLIASVIACALLGVIGFGFKALYEWWEDDETKDFYDEDNYFMFNVLCIGVLIYYLFRYLWKKYWKK
jgi:hypothetical protein